MAEVILGQIGVGNWGKNVLRNFVSIPEVRLKSICDLDEGSRQRALRQFPGVASSTQYQDIVSDPEINAVVVATQSDTHFEIASEALANDKHVFVEKPMTLTAETAKTLVGSAKAKKRILMVGHILEYHPAFLKMKELIDSGELGDIYYTYSTRVNLGVVRESENALWSFAPHDISVALMLMGQEPVQVSCSGQAYLRKGVDDVAFTTLHFPDHKMAHIHVSWLDPHKIRKLTVVGSKKMAVVDDMESSEKMRIYDKGVAVSGDFVPYGEALTLRIGDIQIPYIKMQEPLGLECRHFIDCILNNKVPKSDGKDGLRVVKVLEAAQKSLDQGGVPVRIE